MRPSPPSEYQRLLRFGFVGLANTALGYSVILAFLAMGYGDYLSNFAGYAAGLTLSFFLNGWWTFDNRTRLDQTMLLKYAATFLLAYSVNLGIVAGARARGFVDNPLTHLTGIGAYAVIFYVGCLKFVYAPAGETTPQASSSQRKSSSTRVGPNWRSWHSGP
jgi:putative flippase GtrA